MEKKNFIENIVRFLNEAGIKTEIERVQKIYTFYLELMKWNKKINLTAITDPEEFVEKHVKDSAYLLKILKGKKIKLMDIGSGAGFPGIIVKILNPDIHLVSVESVLKKCNFQKYIARKLALEGFICINANIFALKNIDDINALVTRAAFNVNELIDLIAGIDIRNDGRIFLFLTDAGDIKKIKQGNFKNKKLYKDKILRYKINNKDCRIIASYKIKVLQQQ